MPKCPLCQHKYTSKYLDHTTGLFHRCGLCHLIFRDPKTHLSPVAEKQRYLAHNNNVNDPDYQQFVAPIVNSVIRDFSEPANGLDFGAGTGPVISKMLSESGHTMTLYDPFFHPEVAALEHQYDFIVCCEVIEHFRQPKQEFLLLKKMLAPHGKLYCMTHLATQGLDFKNWYYKNDKTHVAFYSKKNLEWIRRHFQFSKLSVENRLLVFSN